MTTELKPCSWREDWEGNWETDCGRSFIMIDGAPEDNDMKYCCYCGRELKQVLLNDDPNVDLGDSSD